MVRSCGLMTSTGSGEGCVAVVCCELQVAEQTYYRRRTLFDELKAENAKRLKNLMRENVTRGPVHGEPAVDPGGALMPHRQADLPMGIRPGSCPSSHDRRGVGPAYTTLTACRSRVVSTTPG